MEEFTIKDVEYKDEPFCEHCGDLEPYTATYGDGCDYCVDCGRMGDLEINDEEYEQIQVEEAKMKMKYYAERIEKLHKFLIEKETV